MKFKYIDCNEGSGNNLERALSCVNDYIRDIKEDNIKLTEIFRKDYSQYL